MARHVFTHEECSRGYHAVLEKYPEWGQRFLTKRKFKSYKLAKRKNRGKKKEGEVHRGEV